MKNFSLIKSLNTEEDIQPSSLGISYQQYELTVENESILVNIPLRETIHFERAISKSKSPLTKKNIKKLLREFRGIRG